MSSQQRQKKMTDTLNHNLDRQLKSFENIQEWADIGYWLTRVENILKENPSPLIVNKIQFSKRLAQCLNNRLPIGIHFQTLKLYEIVFNNMKKPFGEEQPDNSIFIKLLSEDLALYSVGLFPFFKLASSQVKPNILQLIEIYFFQLGNNILPCLSGLVVSILPGLDDQSENINRLVWKILDKLQGIAGEKYLIGSVWQAILKSDRAKNSGLKYLQKRIPKNVIFEDDEQIQQQQSQTQSQGETYNDILKQIDQEGKQKQDIEINYPNKKTLVLNAMISCLEDEKMQIKRNALDFMYTHLNLFSDLLDDQDKFILMKSVLKLLIRIELSLCRRIYTWMFGKPDQDNKYLITNQNRFVLDLIIKSFKSILDMEPQNNQQATLGLKIIQNFYMEHEHMLEDTLPFLSYSIIKYIQKYQSNGKYYSQDVYKSGERFLENFPSHYQIIIKSLNEMLASFNDQLDIEKASEIIMLLDFVYEKFIYLCETLTVNYRIQILLVILVGIIQSHQLIIDSIEKQQLKYSIQSISLLSRIMGSFLSLYVPDFEQFNENFKNQIYSKFDLLLEKMEIIYQDIVLLVNASQKEAPIQTRQQMKRQSTFEQNPAQSYDDNISNEIINLFNLSSQFIFKVQKQTRTVNKVPEWINQMCQCLNSNNSSILIITSELILEILKTTDSGNIYSQIRLYIQQKPEQYSKIAIEKLWLLIDQPIFQLQAINILSNVQKKFGQIFSEVVVQSFDTSLISQKDFAIKRFSIYWKYTGEAENYKKQQTKKCDNNGLFLMLDFMDHENPLLRHSSKTWLLDSIPLFYRILDPILEVMLNQQNNQMVDYTQINEAFKKLKSILVVSGDLFIQYISKIQITDHTMNIQNLFFLDYNKTEQNDLFVDDYQIEYYLDILIKITLYYIQNDSIDLNNMNDYNQVNASSCEFLEYLITKIHNKQIQLIVIQKTLEKLLQILKKSIQNKDYVMEVQLLNLLKIILQNQSFYSIPQDKTLVKQKNLYSQLITGPLFFANLLQGLDTIYSYVKVQFINLISISIPIVSEFISQNDLTQLTIKVFTKYFELLNNQLEKNIQNRIKQENIGKTIIQSSQIVDTSNQLEHKRVNSNADQKRKTILKHDNLFKQKAIDVSTNGVDKQSFQNTNNLVMTQKNDHEIYLILEGCRAILDYFLKLDINDQWNLEFPITKKKGQFETIMIDILTLGLYHSKNEAEQKQVQQYQESQQAILNFSVFISYYLIRCFQNSDEFVEFIQFDSYGIIPYSFESYNQFNKVLQEKLKNQDLKIRNVKNIILQTLRPMASQYTEKIMHAFIKNWNSICQNDNIQCHSNENLMGHQIELMAILNIPVELLLNSMIQTETFKFIQEYQPKRVLKLKKQGAKNVVIPNYQMSLQESQILFFIYSYLSYVYIDPNNLKKENLIVLWNSVIKFVNFFKKSNSPNTYLWIVDLLLLVSKKYTPKEILNENELAKQIHQTTRYWLQKLCDLCIDKDIYIYDIKDMEGMQISNEDQIKHFNQYQTIVPFSPQIYNLYQEYNEIKNGSKETVLDLSKYKQLNQIFEQKQISNSDFRYLYKYVSYKTIKNVIVELLRNCYSSEKIDKVSMKIKVLLEPLFVIIANKDESNQIFVECASELLCQVLDSSKQILIKLFSRNIIEIFEQIDFFKCSKNTLNSWSKIIDWLVTIDKNDFFNEQLSKVTFGSFSLFSNKVAEDKQKIKKFERICFIIYSGTIDKYEKKLSELLDKMSEVIKNAESQHPSLLIMVLFCIRIIVLRLSQKTLNDLFRNIWMMILTLLIQIFKKDKKNNKLNNPNLILAGLKIVELFSVIGIDEFNLHQWIFVFDYFGISIVEEEGVQIKDQDETNNTQISDINQFNKANSQYQPLISKHLPPNFNVSYQEQKENKDKYLIKSTKRQLIITNNQLENEEIKHKALWLCQYFIQNNEYRMQIDLQQVENMIEEEFITLDDYIFRI